MSVEVWYFSSKNRRQHHIGGRTFETWCVIAMSGEPCDWQSERRVSESAYDALRTVGPMLWRVRLHGIGAGDDIAHATRREPIAGPVDALCVLGAFARWCALSAAHLWDMPSSVAKWLVTGDPSLRPAAKRAAERAWIEAHKGCNLPFGVPVNHEKEAVLRASQSAHEAFSAGGALSAAVAASWAEGYAAEAKGNSGSWSSVGSAKTAEHRAMFERMCHDLLDGNHWWEAKQ